jgi:hypothetical protein
MLSDARTLKQLDQPRMMKSSQHSQSEIALQRTELTCKQSFDEKGSKMRVKMENSAEVK